METEKDDSTPIDTSEWYDVDRDMPESTPTPTSTPHKIHKLLAPTIDEGDEKMKSVEGQFAKLFLGPTPRTWPALCSSYVSILKKATDPDQRLQWIGRYHLNVLTPASPVYHYIQVLQTMAGCGSHMIKAAECIFPSTTDKAPWHGKDWVCRVLRETTNTPDMALEMLHVMCPKMDRPQESVGWGRVADLLYTLSAQADPNDVAGAQLALLELATWSVAGESLNKIDSLSELLLLFPTESVRLVFLKSCSWTVEARLDMTVVGPDALAPFFQDEAHMASVSALFPTWKKAKPVVATAAKKPDGGGFLDDKLNALVNSYLGESGQESSSLSTPQHPGPSRSDSFTWESHPGSSRSDAFTWRST